MADLPLDPIPQPDRSNRRPTIDDVDDIDDEDGAATEEEALNSDLSLHAVDPGEVTGPSGTFAEDEPTLDRDDRGAVNVDDADFEDDEVNL